MTADQARSACQGLVRRQDRFHTAGMPPPFHRQSWEFMREGPAGARVKGRYSRFIHVAWGREAET